MSKTENIHKNLYLRSKEGEKKNDLFGWFEELYKENEDQLDNIPWVDKEPNPFFVEWVNNNPGFLQAGQSALVIGCGLGDDSEYLSELGMNVTAFDISETAIKACKSLYPDSSVSYHCYDLFDTPDEWENKFDFVLEVYTLQAIAEKILPSAEQKIARFVKKDGHILCVARGRLDTEPPKEALPRPLTKGEFDHFTDAGLTEIAFENFVQEGETPIRRFRLLYKKI